MRRPGVVSLLPILVFTALTAGADVRSVSDAERASAQAAASYLSRGAEAIYEQLAPASPLRRMQQKQALEEIEVRLGPPAGARWEMQTVVPALKDRTAAFTVAYPSGLDENVFFDLVAENGQYRINDIRILALPSAREQIFAPQTSEPAPAKPSMLTISAGAAIVVAACIVFLAVILLRGRGVMQRLAFLVAAIAGGAGFFFAATEEKLLVIAGKAEVKASSTAAVPELSPLLRLRRALAAGSSDVGPLFSSAPSSGVTGDVARLWKAQWDLLQMRTDAVRQNLATFPSPSQVPLAELIRARLALTQNDDLSAIMAYERAVNLGPGRDALWLETAEALSNGGFKKQSDGLIRRLDGIGTREAVIYYAQAMDSAAFNRFDDCEAQLKEAWNLCPVERGRLVGSDVLYWLMRRRGPSFIDLSTPNEATFASPAVSTRAITLPDGAAARVSGDFLQVKIGDQELFVPGGAALAPAGSAVVDAGTWARDEEDRALKEVPELTAAASTVGAYMQPVLRRRIRSSAAALARRNRWNDLVELTRGISAKSQFVPVDLFFLRAVALRRLQRDPEAKELLHEVAASPVLERRGDARALAALGEQLAEFDEYDLAIKMYQRAKAARSDPYLDFRLTQLEMNKRLMTSYSVYDSPHFSVHYPPDVSPATAIAVAKVLEGEQQRLQKWVPVPNFKPVVVNIVWWNDFKAIYTGTDEILGFYRGSITLPLAGLMELDPEVVAIITHELTHAMLAQATNDQAPHWFQEALAQRMMMVPMVPNAFNMYEDNKLLALTVLDSVLDDAQDSGMMGEAYIVSQTLIRYLESKYGENATSKLIQSFASGATTEEAMQALTGQDLSAIDVDFRSWGRAEKRVFENPPGPTYQLTGEDMIQRAEPETIPSRLKGGTLHPFKRP